MVKIGDIKRILLFGHSGFIGSNLERYLHENIPDVEIVGKSYPPFDLTDEEEVFSISDLFDTSTTVVMLSALKKEHGDTLDNYSKNMKMIGNLCKILEKHPVKHFIYFSSAAVYGEDIDNDNITEDTPIHPTSYYGMAKYASERLLFKTINSQKETVLTVLRPPVIYGPGDQPCYGPSGFIKSFLTKEDITLWGDGKEMREFIFIDDVVGLIYKLIIQPYGGVLNLASGESHSFKEILDNVSSFTESKVNVSSRKRTKDKVDHHFNNELIQKVFPDVSFTTLDEGIKKTINYYQSE